MTSSPDRITVFSLLKGIARSMPDAIYTARGLWHLVRMKPGQTGSIGGMIERLAQRQPNALALRFEGRSWTYRQFNEWANRIAAVLKDAGLGPGDAVAIMMENRAEVLACVAATVKLGAISGMLNYQQRGEVLAHGIRLTKAKLLLVGEECLSAIEETEFTPQRTPGCTYLWEGTGPAPAGWISLRERSASAPSGNPPEAGRIVMKAPAFYVFTSGTTGLPKASVMTHYRWMRAMAGLGQLGLRLRRDDVLYCPLPLYHNNALTVSWGAVLGAGAAMALGRRFSASQFWDEIRRVQATSFCYIGELCRYLLNRPPTAGDRDHRVRAIIGNGLRPEIWDEFQTRFGIRRIAEFYAASEGNAAFVNGFDQRRTAGFSPLPFAIVEWDNDAEAPVRGPDGYMRKVPTGGVGLLVTEVSERVPFDGYTDKKSSDAKLFRDVFAEGDVWFNTGDLVRDQGLRHIQFADRVGDTFRWKGENVATTEVEAALNGFDGVEQAVVYGVEVPGADGRAGMAALSLRSPQFDGPALARHLRKVLPPYAVPLFLRLRSEQEVTSTFKFRKVDLKRAGFDPGKIGDPLYVLADASRGYEPLTQDIYRRICGGGMRL